MKITHKPLPYQDLLDNRSPNQITLLVIHCTELPDLTMAREYGSRILYPSGTGNSGHYYIDIDGTTECWVTPEFVAHHVANHNSNSIGIELVNKGRYPDWFDSKKQTPTTPYPKVQIKALNDLVNHLSNNFTQLKYIVGHEDLDQRTVEASDDNTKSVQRKIDPGPIFPWSQVMQSTTLINIGSNAKHQKDASHQTTDNNN